MIKSKSIKVIEISGTGEVKLERGERVKDTKIIHQNAPENSTTGVQYPTYKTVVVLECVEYEDD
jgi:hypothetical protein